MQMKFVLLALFGAAFAQKDIVLGQLEKVHHALDSLDSSVGKLVAGGDVAAQAASLTAQSGAVLAAIQGATAAISASAALDVIGASSIVGPADHLVKETEKTIADLVAKKDVIAGAKQTALVLDQLKSQAAAAQQLADAITSKVPDATKEIAKSQSAKITAAINKGVSAFS
jgi:hypothetical protein